MFCPLNKARKAGFKQPLPISGSQRLDQTYGYAMEYFRVGHPGSIICQRREFPDMTGFDPFGLFPPTDTLSIDHGSDCLWGNRLAQREAEIEHLFEGSPHPPPRFTSPSGR